MHPRTADKQASEEIIQVEEETHSRSCLCPDLFPHRLLIVAVLTWIFLSVYYYTRCQQAEDGAWVSKPLYLPKSLHFSPLTAYFPSFFELEVEDTPLWSFGT